jgi:hypothetical protein
MLIRIVTNTNTMQIITKEIEAAFAKQGKTGSKSMKEIKIVLKLFNPAGAQTWYLYEKLDEDVYMCFANLGDSEMAECGTVSMSELMSLRLPFGLKIERDRFFKPLSMTLEEVWNTVKKGGHV